MKYLDEFIEKKTDSINTIGITDGIDEEYLKEICEEYYKIKSQLHIVGCSLLPIT